MQTITHAAQDALNAEVRVPNGPSLPKPPNNAVQDAHRLTHTPYQPWCESCVAHRAGADKHVHDFSSMEGSTKAGEASQEPDALVALVMVDSKTGYLGCVPMNSKAQFDLATKEVIAFCQTLGYNDFKGWWSRPDSRWYSVHKLAHHLHMSMEKHLQRMAFRESEVLLEVSCMGCKRSWELQ